MPEGHTIHRLARDHRDWFAGQKLTLLSPQGRFEEGAAKLSGRRLKDVEAHGKHLCYRWPGDRLLHIHLGLYGKFRVHPSPPPEPRGEVRLRLIGEERAFDLNGPNRCEVISAADWRALRDRLGADPLRDDADVEEAWRRIGSSRAAIGSLLLNQAVVAGVGNIYRSEVLFLLGMHPETPGRALEREEFDRMWQYLTDLMSIGMRYNRIIIATPERVGKPRGRMRRDERLLVYKREHCVDCGSKIRTWQLAARKVFACPKCQQKRRA